MFPAFIVTWFKERKMRRVSIDMFIENIEGVVDDLDEYANYMDEKADEYRRVGERAMELADACAHKAAEAEILADMLDAALDNFMKVEE